MLVLTLLLTSFAHASFNDTLSQLDKMKSQMVALINEARECLPEVSDSEITLCTGLKLKGADVAKLKALDVASCEAAIRAGGYTPARAKPAQLTTEEFDSFSGSTKRAETFHDKKVVLFKTGVSDRIDCIHELLHVYQWTREGDSKLAPPNRKERGEKFSALLEEGVGAIEAVEGKGDKARALEMSDQITARFAVLKAWNQLADLLDEKDVHYTIYALCPKLGCELADRDAALANLYKRKAFLPKSYHSTLAIESAKVLQELKRR